VSVAVLVLASVAAWSLAGRVLRPVAQLTDTALQITETDLSARIPVEGDDELARLGHTINSMLDRLETAVVSQRSFLNDIAHDLRTPITVVRGHLEVLGDDPHERQETLELVTEELDRMGRFVSDLLVLAKAEQPDFLRVGLVDLGEWAGDLLSRVESLADRRFVLDPVPSPGHRHRGGRSGAADPGGAQPGGERGAAHRSRRRDPHLGGGGRRVRDGHRRRRRVGHRPGAAPHALRARHPRRREPQDQTGGHRARARHRPSHRRGPRRDRSRRQRARRGCHLHHRFPVDPAGRIGLEEVPCPGS
jgi:HAMP domain-containing protein